MRFILLLFLFALLTGCATRRDDARLQGAWVVNREATAAVSSNVPPAQWVTYSHGKEMVEGDQAQYGHWNVSFHYHVVERGSNYVVLRTTAPADKKRKIHIRFVDADSGYWTDYGPLGYGVQEKFERFRPKPLPAGSGGVIVPPPIPLDW